MRPAVGWSCAGEKLIPFTFFHLPSFPFILFHLASLFGLALGKSFHPHSIYIVSLLSPPGLGFRLGVLAAGEDAATAAILGFVWILEVPQGLCPLADSDSVAFCHRNV